MIRDHGGGVDGDHGLVGGLVEIHAGRADDLGDDDALGAVDDEGAAVGHDGEVAHEDLLLLDLLGLLVAQAHTDLQRLGVGSVAGLALLLVVLGLLVHGVVDEAQLQVSGIVGHGIHVLEDLAQTGLQEPLVRALLDLQQIGHIPDLIDTGKALSQGLAVENIFWHGTLSFSILKRPAQLSESQSPALILQVHAGILNADGWWGRVPPPLHK